MSKMINPTGKEVRATDAWGSGAFRAPRGNHIHEGVDFICEPGQDVYSPITGRIIREARPYTSSSYSGMLIRNDDFDVKIFYLELDKTLIGKNVIKGTVIGTAQDISKKYEGITPHVHLEISMCNPLMFINDEES